MKKRILSLIAGALLFCASFGLIACGEGYANYFNVIKNPKNFKIEYICDEDLFTEIRVGNKVALKTTWDDGGTSISKNTEWTIYRNVYKEQSNLYYDSQFARTTDYYRYATTKSEWEKTNTIFLGREAVVYQQKGISSYFANADSEGIDREYTEKYIVDKQYDVILAEYFTWDGDDEKTFFEVTLFEIGGQELPDNPTLS